VAKDKTRYVCQQCGYLSSAYLGRCPSCQSWESFSEERQKAKPNNKTSERAALIEPRPLSLVPNQETIRLKTGIIELDRVLGGGLTPGGVILLSGEPGVGKSTLLLQAAAGAAQEGRKLLYVTGEESAAQVRSRAERLKLDPDVLWVLAHYCLPDIEEQIEKGDWDVLAVDSIQTLQIPQLGSPAGSPVQIRECASRLIALAKAKAVPLWLVGHITKDGQIAGPKLLEHLVDTVLYFEGERDRPLRILRSFKNRFGSINEAGIFEMTGTGLGQVLNPSAFFLAERPKLASGSVVASIMEGCRPLLLEIQALVSPSPLAIPRRQTLGVDQARVGLLAAVLEKKVRLRLFDRDIFVNVTGGAKVGEPAADLAVAAAIASSWLDKPIAEETVVIGEVGLAGEVRSVGRLKERLKEAERMGFTRAIAPLLETKGLMGLNLEVQGTPNLARFLAQNFGFLGGRMAKGDKERERENGDGDYPI
jgi:DNA repair protein RadA/Sms